MPLSAGDKLGPYEILAPIGVRGMGEVWKARDTRLDRIVAIKRLKAAHSARFEQEARAIAALNHPHICQIYDIGPDYLVLEFIDGAPVKGPMAVEDAVRIGVQIAGALEAAHAKGILHRDLKPGNVLLSASGPKLLDFGLAKLTADSNATQTMAISGTPLYMSPEQAEGKPLDVRSDIFSFGAVLYELIAGRRAFESLAAVLRDDPAAPNPATMDSPVVEVVARCLKKQAAQRYQSMAEVRAALEQVGLKPAQQQPSIAVLPFADMSAGKDQEYFADGLAEEILNLLAQIPSLKVIARTSSFAFRGKEQDIRRIAEALDVKTILEGSVRRSGNRIRVTAQLIDAQNGAHLWSERYDRELTDVFEVQDEVAAAVAAALRLRLVSPATHKHQPNLPAYEAFLKGRNQLEKLTLEGYEAGRKYLEQAIALDPDYADPHAELGQYYYYRAMRGAQPPKEAMPLARACALRALELEPSNGGAHAALCFVAGFYDYDWEEAEKQHRLTVAVPAPAWARAVAALSLLPFGRFEEAVHEIEAALALDPLNVVPRVLLGSALSGAGLYDRVIAEALKAIEIDENQPAYYNNLVGGYVGQGRLAEALAPAERAYQLAPWDNLAIAGLAGILARLGEKDRAEQIAANMPETATRAWMMYHTSCSNIDAALDWYEKMIESRNPVAPWLARYEPYKAFRESPRWPRLARMMNLPA